MSLLRMCQIRRPQRHMKPIISFSSCFQKSTRTYDIATFSFHLQCCAFNSCVTFNRMQCIAHVLTHVCKGSKDSLCSRSRVPSSVSAPTKRRQVPSGLRDARAGKRRAENQGAGEDRLGSSIHEEISGCCPRV